LPPEGGLIGAGVGDGSLIVRYELKGAGIEDSDAVGVAVGGADALDHKIRFEDRIVRRIEAEGARVHADVDSERIRL